MITPLPQLAAAPQLDLAFDLEADLAKALLLQAGPLADRLQAEQHWQKQLQSWLLQLADELPPALRSSAYSLGLQLVGDTAIAQLNADWRQQSGPTDVLAFAAQDEGLEGAPPMPLPLEPDDEEPDLEPLELGDIVISLDSAARQALDQGHSLERELLFLASHGLLHLLGWDHPDPTSLASMLERQERLLA